MSMHEKRTQEIGRVVAVFLALGGTTQAEMARGTGIDPATISRRMHGRGQWTAGELDAIASFLDVPITTLFVRPEELRDRLVGGAMIDRSLSWPLFEAGEQLELALAS